jgi:putative intracellular protease/amidase
MQLVEKGATPETHRISVAVLLFDGAEIIDYAGPWEAFGEAGFKIFTVAATTQPVKAVFGQVIKPDYTFEKSPAADILLVPGGGGVQNATRNAKLIQWVQKNAESSKQVMSVCTGAFILAKAGLLDGLEATTVSHGIDKLAEAAPKTHVVHDQRYVDNGKIITTAGLSSGIDGAFHLIGKLKGKGVAQSTALGMEYRWDPDSKFARAALADRYFPDLDVEDILATDGDTNHWELKVVMSKPGSVAEIKDLLVKRIVSSTPHTRTKPAFARPAAPGEASTANLQWSFMDEEGATWDGWATIEPASGQPGKFLVTAKLQRQGPDKAAAVKVPGENGS